MEITGLPLDKAAQELRHLNVSMFQANINTVARKAAYIAQLAHESMGMKRFEEIASGRKYEGRRDLGNTRPGDGKRYRGRGAIQVTGRANYREATRDLGDQLGGTDLEAEPERADDPDVRYLTAAWFWEKRGLNKHADRGRFDTITRRINGGLNGKADRDRYHRKALRVLGG